MPKKKKKKNLKDIMKVILRKQQNAQGYFDGRFKTRSVPNKKKQVEKKACRKKLTALDE